MKSCILLAACSACSLMTGCATSASNPSQMSINASAMPIDTRPIVVEETYPVPAPVVWQAITDPSRMREWYFGEIETFAPEVGSATRFNVRLDDRDFWHVWEVREVVPNQKIAYTFNYEGYDGDALVVWELAEIAGQTKLKVTHTGLHTFPQDVDAFAREACEGGWRYFLGDSLKKYLASRA